MINKIDGKDFSIKADILITNLPDSSCYSFKQTQIKIDRLKNHLASNASVIPKQKTLFIRPIMAHSLTSKFDIPELVYDAANETSIIEMAKNDTERIYQVLLKHFYFVSEPKAFIAIDFDEYLRTTQNQTKEINDSRMSVLKYQIGLDCVLSGFVGYFQTEFSDNFVLNQQNGDLDDMTSGPKWFTGYFPLTSLQQLRKDQELEATFWFSADCLRSRMWFEWCTNKPIPSFIHNQNGDTCCKNIS